MVAPVGKRLFGATETPEDQCRNDEGADKRALRKTLIVWGSFRMAGRRQEILERAYALWEAEGCQHGNDLAHWFRAEAEIPLCVTFDSNTFDKVSRPSVYPNDTAHADMVEIHEAIRRGDVQGFVSDTALTLEGIGVDHRATVFGGTIVRSSMAQTSNDTFTITITPEQPDRGPVHPKQAERFREAFGLGIRLLGAPRIGMPRAEEQFYAVEDPSQLGERLDRYFNLAREIEKRGLASRRAEVLAVRLAAGAPSSGPWFTSLGNARDIHETREVGRAVAEWADGDSIAAHYAYANDFFCTLDSAKGERKRGDPAILDAANRAWLSADYGIQFITISELAKKLRK